MQVIWFQPLDWEDLLEKGKATHFSISGLENPGVTKSWTRLSDIHCHLDI